MGEKGGRQEQVSGRERVLGLGAGREVAESKELRNQKTPKSEDRFNHAIRMSLHLDGK